MAATIRLSRHFKSATVHVKCKKRQIQVKVEDSCGGEASGTTWAARVLEEEENELSPSNTMAVKKSKLPCL